MAMDSSILLSVGVFFFFTALAQIATKIAGRNQSLEIKRFWRLTFRHTGLVVILIVLGVIWRAQLQALLIAMGAAVATLFVTFREAWLSLFAFWLHVVKRHYSVGDYIEIDGLRGKVVDVTWQHTVLAEVSPGKAALPFTGRQLQIPNNRTILTNMAIDNMTGKFTPHGITFHLPSGAKMTEVKRLLLALATKHCESFKEEAALHMKMYQSKNYVEAPSIEPKITILGPAHGGPALHLRIVVPAHQKMIIEQAILHDFYANIDKTHQGASASSSTGSTASPSDKKH